jgi:N,N'-diacetyllegionaminate synthase
MMLEDFESALNPDEFYEFSKTLRDCDEALGSASSEEDFNMSESERGYRKMIRRHVVASRDLVEGSILQTFDLVLKRTSYEQIITDLKEVYDKKITNNISRNSAITFKDLL